MDKKTTIIIISIALILIIAYFSFYREISVEETKPIKLGFLGSSTPKDKKVFDVINLAIEEINQVERKQSSELELIYYTIESENELKSYFKKLKEEDKVLAAISTFVNHSRIAEEIKLPTIFIGPNKLGGLEREDPFFWSLENSYILGDNLARNIFLINLSFSPESAMIINDFSPNNIKYYIIIQPKIIKAGINYLGHHTFTDENLSEVVSIVKKENPELLIMATDTDKALKFFKEAKIQNFNPKLYLATSEVTRGNLLQNKDLFPDNLYISSYLTSAFHDPSIKPKEKFDVIDNTLIRRTGGYLTSEAMNAYDSVQIINDVLKRSIIKNTEESLEEDRRSLIDNIWATDFFISLRGTIYPDGSTGLLRRTYARILRVVDGEYTIWKESVKYQRA